MTDLQERILTAAAKVYAETGFRGTTTRRVAIEAGVNEITLFRHFGNKETLLKAALQRMPAPPEKAVLTEPKAPEVELYAWAHGLYRHWYEGRNLICRVMGDMVEQPELAPTLCEEPGCEHAMLSRYLERMRELGLARAPFHAEAAAGMLMGAIFTHAVWRDHYHDPNLPPPEEVIRQYVSLLLGAVGAATLPPVAPEARSA